MDEHKDTPDQERGLYHKYNVTKVSTGEEVQNCIVLRPDKDEKALYALRVYAGIVSTQYPDFSKELNQFLDVLEDQR